MTITFYCFVVLAMLGVTIVAGYVLSSFTRWLASLSEKRAGSLKRLEVDGGLFVSSSQRLLKVLRNTKENAGQFDFAVRRMAVTEREKNAERRS